MLTLNETPLSVQQPTSGIINDFFQNLLMLRNHIRSILLSLSRHHTLVTVYAAPLEGAAAAPICGSLLLSCRMTSCGSPFFTSADLIYGFKKGRPSQSHYFLCLVYATLRSTGSFYASLCGENVRHTGNANELDQDLQCLEQSTRKHSEKRLIDLRKTFIEARL